MNNIILKSLSVENFASFANKANFTTEIDYGKKENLQNTFQNGDEIYNKVSFLYGANGSGKTFFCKSILEIQRLLDLAPLVTIENKRLLQLPHFKGINSPVKTFAFDVDYKDKPTSFEIDVQMNSITYHYEFAISKKEITYELLTKKKRRTEKLIERTSPCFKDITVRSELKDFEGAKHTVKKEALCLPVAALLNNQLASKIVNAIKSISVVNMTSAKLSPTNSRNAFSDERKKKYIKILQKADPTIRNMLISFEEEEITRQKFEDDDFENRSIIAKKTTVGVTTEHALYREGEETDKISVPFFADESLGTIKLFTALPYLYDVLEHGGILVIDEIENGLHLSLAKEIINLFTNETSNPNHAQLICTSHQPLLLDGDFRRDQVWVTSKDFYGKSSLHRISELQTPRAQVNLVKKILNNAFGCNPDKFFENNT